MYNGKYQGIYRRYPGICVYNSMSPINKMPIGQKENQNCFNWNIKDTGIYEEITYKKYVACMTKVNVRITNESLKAPHPGHNMTTQGRINRPTFGLWWLEQNCVTTASNFSVVFPGLIVTADVHHHSQFDCPKAWVLPGEAGTTSNGLAPQNIWSQAYCHAGQAHSDYSVCYVVVTADDQHHC